ncbi:MAG: hypothetical protein K2X77_17470 [Candidatus Obscuribacterales bacterium]|nr:hypothetical protein [Candidatus Obscuribacterales bacterium]
MKAIACVHKKYLGTRSGRASRFAVLDVDANSKYHNTQSVHKIQSQLADAGLKESIVYQSSNSGGWHIYISFDEPISSRDLRWQLVNFLKYQSYDIVPGTLEVFPNPGDASLGYGLRLPLQPGFSWLNQTTFEIAHERDDWQAQHALDLFMADFDESANSYHDFHRFKAHVEQLQQKCLPSVETVTPRTAQVVPIRSGKAVTALSPSQQSVIEIFGFLPPNIRSDDWLRGRKYYEEGLTGQSQRDDATKSLSHYFFYGDPSRQLPARGYGRKEERDQAISDVIYSKHNGFSVGVAKGKSDVSAQITRCANWEPPDRRDRHHSTSEFEVPIVWTRANAKRSLGARNRIARAVASLAGQAFSLRTLRSVAKCGMDTLYKHKDLWQAAYDQSNQSPLASDPGEYNAVESSSVVLSDSSSELTYSSPDLAHEMRVSWYKTVHSTTLTSPDRLDRKSLKTAISTLTILLDLAPTALDYVVLQSVLSEFRDELSERVSVLKLVERAPP